LRAINDWVIIERDATDDTFDGVEISDGAKVLSYMAKVHSSNDNDFVKKGDRVHIPHHTPKIKEFEFGGVEYSAIRVSDFFAKEIDGQFRPINGNLKVLKCQNDHIRDADGEIALHMTEKHQEDTTWVEILDVADDCVHVTRDDIGSFFNAPEENDKMQRLLYSKEYCIAEELAEFLTDGE